MLDLHLSEDGRSIVGDGDVTVGGDEDLVESWMSRGGSRGKEREGRELELTRLRSLPWFAAELAMATDLEVRATFG